MNRLIEIFDNFNSEIIVVNPLNKIFKRGYEVFSDARSAAFYAMGKAIKEDKVVILILNGEFLSNIYTAITEAWFQKCNLLVVSLFNSVSEVNTYFMDRCTVMNRTVGFAETEVLENYLDDSKKFIGPKLLSVVCADRLLDKVEVNNFDDAITTIREVEQNKVEITCFNCANSSVNNIPYNYKYGVISKYIGKSVVKDNGYLICDEKCVLVDVNVFRIRYKKKNMKIIIYCDEAMNDFDLEKWIINNGWECRVDNAVTIDNIKWMSKAECASVLLIRKER